MPRCVSQLAPETGVTIGSSPTLGHGNLWAAPEAAKTNNGVTASSKAMSGR